MNNAVMFGKATDEWRTPQAFFEALDAEFGFDVDVAATAENRWCETYFGPDHHHADRRDALVIPWFNSVCWMNPPYSKVRAFMEKAAAEAQCGQTVVCLVPSRTDTKWWHAHVWDRDKNQPRPGVEVRFVKGRIVFLGADGQPMRDKKGRIVGAPFPSVVIVFRPVEVGATVAAVDPVDRIAKLTPVHARCDLVSNPSTASPEAQT